MYASVNWISIGSDKGLSPDRRQAIIWTYAGILLIGALGTSVKFESKYKTIHENAFSKYRMGNGGHFVQGEMSQ